MSVSDAWQREHPSVPASLPPLSRPCPGPAPRAITAASAAGRYHDKSTAQRRRRRRRRRSGRPSISAAPAPAPAPARCAAGKQSAGAAGSRERSSPPEGGTYGSAPVAAPPDSQVRRRTGMTGSGDLPNLATRDRDVVVGARQFRGRQSKGPSWNVAVGNRREFAGICLNMTKVWWSGMS